MWMQGCAGEDRTNRTGLMLCERCNLFLQKLNIFSEVTFLCRLLQMIRIAICDSFLMNRDMRFVSHVLRFMPCKHEVLFAFLSSPFVAFGNT